VTYSFQTNLRLKTSDSPTDKVFVISAFDGWSWPVRRAAGGRQQDQLRSDRLTGLCDRAGGRAARRHGSLQRPSRISGHPAKLTGTTHGISGLHTACSGAPRPL